MYKYQEVKKKKVELVLWSISAILIRIKCICMCELQNANYSILMILHMSKWSLKPALHDRYKDEQQNVC